MAVKYGIMMLPGIFLWLDWLLQKEEATSLVFPEGYDPFFLALMAAYLLAYFYCTHRRRRSGPNLELLVNLLMAAGMIQNALVAVRLESGNFFQLFFTLPIVLLATAIVRNCYALMEDDK